MSHSYRSLEIVMPVKVSCLIQGYGLIFETRSVRPRSSIKDSFLGSQSKETI